MLCYFKKRNQEKFKMRKNVLKRLMLAIMFCIIASVSCHAQKRTHFRDVYTNVDSVIIENLPSVEQTADGDYLIPLPRKSKLVIAYNADKTKAIVLYSGFQYVKHMEYNVKDDEKRLVLWFKDKHLYCGYTYDKDTKTGRYFEAINSEEKDKLIKRLPFLKRVPTFTDN